MRARCSSSASLTLLLGRVVDVQCSLTISLLRRKPDKFEGRAEALEHQLAEGHLLREKLVVRADSCAHMTRLRWNSNLPLALIVVHRRTHATGGPGAREQADRQPAERRPNGKGGGAQLTLCFLRRQFYL